MPSDAKEADMPPRVFHFASFNVTPQVFHTTSHSFALVNLKPLLPGHVLVSPIRRKPRLSDLTATEISDLFNTVVRVQTTLKRLYKADAFNVAVQDGEAAGQSVPHVHCHVIPRLKGDEAGDDKIHQWLEGEEGDVGSHLREKNGSTGAGDGGEGEKGAAGKQDWPKDEDRKPRSDEEMRKEADWLREEMKKDEGEGEGEKL